MTATATQIQDVRRMIAEPTEATYTDAMLENMIEAYPLTDRFGYSPYDPADESEVNPDWTPTYDLNAVAGAIWAEKASAVAGCFDFNADGGSYSRSQAFRQYMQQARFYQSRRSVKTVTMQSAPKMPPTLDELDSDENNT